MPPGVASAAVPDLDEDVVSMAVEVGRSALADAQVDIADVDGLLFVTCSSPYSEHGAATEVARGLGLPRTAQVTDLAGDARGVVGALRIAADAVAVGRANSVLVIAADRRRGRTGTSTEVLGAGAAAAVIRQGGAVIGAMTSYRHGVPTRWRSDGSLEVQAYDDPRYERDQQVLPPLHEVISGAPAFLALDVRDARSGRVFAKALGCMDADLGDDDVSEVGDVGSAASLFTLARCLGRRPAERGVLIASSPGSGADGLVIEPGPVAVTHCRPPRRDVDYVTYLRAHGLLLPPAPPEPIVPWAATPGAARDDRFGALSAARCRTCGSLSIPASRRCVDCRSADLEPAPVPRVGSIVTHNVQHAVAVHPESAPVAVGVARFAGSEGTRGGQVSAMFVEGGLDRLHVGAPVELVYRRLGCDDGLVKYGWKFRLMEVDDVG